MDEPVLLTIADVAKMLSVCERTVRNLISSSDLPSVRIGRAIRIEKQSVYHFIEVKRQYNNQCVELASSLTGENKCNSISEMASIKCPTSRQVDTRLDALLKPVTKP